MSIEKTSYVGDLTLYSGGFYSPGASSSGGSASALSLSADYQFQSEGPKLGITYMTKLLDATIAITALFSGSLPFKLDRKTQREYFLEPTVGLGVSHFLDNREYQTGVSILLGARVIFKDISDRPSSPFLGVQVLQTLMEDTWIIEPYLTAGFTFFPD